MNYTKGEWKRLGWIIVDKDGVLIADCRRHEPASVFESYNSNRDTPIEEITANAHLIASAPDLYKALKEAANFVNIVKASSHPLAISWELGEVIEKALAKAEVSV